MKDLSHLFIGMFAPTCTAHFISSWGVFCMLAGFFYLSWRIQRRTWELRRDVWNAKPGRDKPNPLSSLFMFVLVIGGCIWAYGYFESQRSGALTSGSYLVHRGGNIHVFKAGTDDFEKHVGILFFCQYLMVFFGSLMVVASVKSLQQLIKGTPPPSQKI